MRGSTHVPIRRLLDYPSVPVRLILGHGVPQRQCPNCWKTAARGSSATQAVESRHVSGRDPLRFHCGRRQCPSAKILDHWSRKGVFCSALNLFFFFITKSFQNAYTMHAGWRWTCDNKKKQTTHCPELGGCDDPLRGGGWNLTELLGGRSDEIRGFNLPNPPAFRALPMKEARCSSLLVVGRQPSQLQHLSASVQATFGSVRSLRRIDPRHAASFSLFTAHFCSALKISFTVLLRGCASSSTPVYF